MDVPALIKFIQGHFTDGLVLVIGSGLSAAEGIPGMPGLQSHLTVSAAGLTGVDAAEWSQIEATLATHVGLEAALLKSPPSETLQAWIVEQTCQFLVPAEQRVISEVFAGTRKLRLTELLEKILVPQAGLPILTPNYDRLIEVGCEHAGLHVDTTAIGIYAGTFDNTRSGMNSCKGIKTLARTMVLDHYPRAVVLKPHGSFDWYRAGGNARRCAISLDAERLIITPGLNKYRAGYDSPFDKHRELANEHIKRSSRLLIIGYGFNDDHLQVHLNKRIESGTPTLILNRSISAQIKLLAENSPRCVCLSKPAATDGFEMVTQGSSFSDTSGNYWDIGVLAREILT